MSDARAASELDACDLDAMEEKYAFMVEARTAHAEGRAIPPHATFRAIGRRFPGALKELERLPRDVLVARLEAVRAARAGGVVPAWLTLVHAYHLTLAHCLALVAARRAADGSTPLACVARPPFDEALERAVRAPQRQKLERIAVAFLARHTGASPEAVADALGFTGRPLRT